MDDAYLFFIAFVLVACAVGLVCCLPGLYEDMTAKNDADLAQERADWGDAA